MLATVQLSGILEEPLVFLQEGEFETASEALKKSAPESGVAAILFCRPNSHRNSLPPQFLQGGRMERAPNLGRGAEGGVTRA
jgi:hypothetical protein